MGMKIKKEEIGDISLWRDLLAYNRGMCSGMVNGRLGNFGENPYLDSRLEALFEFGKDRLIPAVLGGYLYQARVGSKIVLVYAPDHKYALLVAIRLHGTNGAEDGWHVKRIDEVVA